MPIAPIPSLNKDTLVQLYKGRCKHGHNYITHYNCWLQEKPKGMKIGFFDIEASNLKADFGIVLCYCIKDSQSNKVVERVITGKEIDKSLDKEVMKQMIIDLKKFDMIVTYYGTGFDLPFIRTRAANLGLDFPKFGEIYHKDVYYMIKSKYNMSSKRLENACRVLLGKTNKTRIDSNHWLKALRGCKHSLEYIRYHCEQDVRDLEKLYNKVSESVRNIKKSI